MKILVTGFVPKDGLQELYRHFDVTYKENVRIPDEEVRKVLGEYDGALLMGNVIDKAMLDAGTRLKVVATFGVGYDQVDVAYAKEKGVLVCNTPQSVLEPTAETAMALMISAGRRICEYDRNLRTGNWMNGNLAENMGTSLYGAKLGIVGLGRIGKAVARRARAMGMEVIYNKRTRLSAAEEQEHGIAYADLDTLLRESDFVSVHAPLNAETWHLIDRDALAKMKPTAFLINTARGPVVDEAELIKALQTGGIAGAGLDVFEEEPKVPEALTKLDNVVITPHVGSSCLKWRVALTREASANLINALVHHKPTNVVNP